MTNPSNQGPASGLDVLSAHVSSLQESLSALDLVTLQQAGELIDENCLRGHTVFCLGNGGSAATASHIATDLFWGRRMSGEPRPRAVSLVSNVPLMTALANDVNYDEVFVEQLRGQFREGDMIVAVSASGNSPNVVKAAEFAKEFGGTSVGLVGFDGGALKDRCNVSVHVATPPGAYELVEDVHHAVCHMLAGYLKHKAQLRAQGGTR